MRAIENAADIIMKNMWFIFQCIFLVYISALAVMDFKFRKLPLKFLLSGFLLVAFIGFWDLLYLLLGAFSMAAVFSAVMMIRHRFNRKSSFPFVPFLAAAYIGGMFIGAY